MRMEDIYTVRVKTKPQHVGKYPSEKRYSASTVTGLAWVHFTLAAISFLFACLTLVKTQPFHMNINNLHSYNQNLSISDIFNSSDVNETYSDIYKTTINETNSDGNISISYKWILCVAPLLVSLSAMGAGIASVIASYRWYIDQNITWLLLVSSISVLTTLISFVLLLIWLGSSANVPYHFYKNEISHKTDIITNENGTYYIYRIPYEHLNRLINIYEQKIVSKRILAINMVVVTVLEFLWSMLSVKIAWKGKRKTYNNSKEETTTGAVQVKTKIKGNKNWNHEEIPRPDLLNHYTNENIRQILREKTGFPKSSEKWNSTETRSQYDERMINYIDHCHSFDGSSFQDVSASSVHSEPGLEAAAEPRTDSEVGLSVSWGDEKAFPIYNQNNLDLSKILKRKLERTNEVYDLNRSRSTDEHNTSNDPLNNTSASV